jgi:hypothetical protein
VVYAGHIAAPGSRLCTRAHPTTPGYPSRCPKPMRDRFRQKGNSIRRGGAPSAPARQTVHSFRRRGNITITHLAVLRPSTDDLDLRRESRRPLAKGESARAGGTPAMRPRNVAIERNADGGLISLAASRLLPNLEAADRLKGRKLTSKQRQFSLPASLACHGLLALPVSPDLSASGNISPISVPCPRVPG